MFDRFEHHVVRYDDPNACWGWSASTVPTGYGQLFDYRDDKPTMIGAHVISYEKHVGPVPPGMEVCHQCDNPPCTNPKHLFLGTHAENHADKAKKGRSNRWEKNPMAKMTKDLVVKVRKLKDETGRSSRSIALDFGVSETTIRNIVNGKSWAGL